MEGVVRRPAGGALREAEREDLLGQKLLPAVGGDGREWMGDVPDHVRQVGPVVEGEDVATGDVILKDVETAVHEHPQRAVERLAAVVAAEIEVAWLGGRHGRGSERRRDRRETRRWRRAAPSRRRQARCRRPLAAFW